MDADHTRRGFLSPSRLSIWAAGNIEGNESKLAREQEMACRFIRMFGSWDDAATLVASSSDTRAHLQREHLG